MTHIEINGEHYLFVEFLDEDGEKTQDSSKARVIIYQDLESPGPYYVQPIPKGSIEEVPEQ